MLIAATILAATLNTNVDMAAIMRGTDHRANPKTTCRINTVAYRFSGTAGQTFRYGGTTHTLPEDGVVEILASHRDTTYSVQDRSYPLDVNPGDEFGIRDVRLPAISKP
jgi:hypothetical protein